MFTITEVVTVDRPIDEVFAFVGDARNRPQWDASVISESLTSPEPIGVGSTIHTRMKTYGRVVEFDWRVQRFDPPTGMTVVSTSGPMATTLHFALSETDTGCILRASIDAKPTGMMAFAEPMIAASVRSNLSTGLARLKVVLESRPQQ